MALLRALWDHLDRPETWPVLERAATSDDPVVAAGVIRIPADRRSPEALHRLARLLATVLAHPAPQVRLDTLQRCATLPMTDPDRVLLPPLFQAFGSPLPDERTAAARRCSRPMPGATPVWWVTRCGISCRTGARW